MDLKFGLFLIKSMTDLLMVKIDIFKKFIYNIIDVFKFNEFSGILILTFIIPSVVSYFFKTQQINHVQLNNLNSSMKLNKHDLTMAFTMRHNDPRGSIWLSMLLMVFIVYYIENGDQCLKDSNTENVSGKSNFNFDTSRFYWGFFCTYIFTYIITTTLINFGPYGRMKQNNGYSWHFNIMDGIVLIGVYNIVRNIIGIYGINKCRTPETVNEKKENFENDFDSEKELRNKSEKSLDELKEIKKEEEKDLLKLKKSNKIKTPDELINESQTMLKNEDIFVGRTDLYEVIDKLQQEQKDINIENLKNKLNLEQPKMILTLEEKSKKMALPDDRRRIKAPIFNNNIEDGLPNIFKKNPPKESDIDDVVLTKKGRLIAFNLEKLQEKRINKLQNL